MIPRRSTLPSCGRGDVSSDRASVHAVPRGRCMATSSTSSSRPSRAVSCLRACAFPRNGSSPSASASAARQSSARTGSSSRVVCCAATSDVARSCAQRPSPRRRLSPGEGRSRRRPCARVIRRCAMRSATRPTRGFCRLQRGNRRSTAFPTAAFQQAIEDVLKRHAHAVWSHGHTEGQPVLREAIADDCGRRKACWCLRAPSRAGSAREMPGRSGDAVTIDLQGIRSDSLFPRGRRETDRMGRRRSRPRRARRSARALPAEADLHEPDVS